MQGDAAVQMACQPGNKPPLLLTHPCAAPAAAKRAWRLLSCSVYKCHRSMTVLSTCVWLAPRRAASAAAKAAAAPGSHRSSNTPLLGLLLLLNDGGVRTVVVLALLRLLSLLLLLLLLLLCSRSSSGGNAWLLWVLPAAALLLLAEACLARLMRTASARGAAAPLTLRCSAAAWTCMGPETDMSDASQVFSNAFSTACACSGLQD